MYILNNSNINTFGESYLNLFILGELVQFLHCKERNAVKITSEL